MPADQHQTEVNLSDMKLGELIDYKAALKQETDAINAELKRVKELDNAAEAALFAAFEEQGMTKASGKLATISIKESIVPTVRDWDAYYAFIKANDYFHLLEKRPSAPGCRELFERDGSIPGVEPFNKRSLHFTAL